MGISRAKRDAYPLLSINATFSDPLGSFRGIVGKHCKYYGQNPGFCKPCLAGSYCSFFYRFFKPVIGAAFALFVFAVLCAGILPITISPERRPEKPDDYLGCLTPLEIGKVAHIRFTVFRRSSRRPEIRHAPPVDLAKQWKMLTL